MIIDWLEVTEVISHNELFFPKVKQIFLRRKEFIHPKRNFEKQMFFAFAFDEVQKGLLKES